MVEDASYYWTLSRYIHLNPCNCVKPLADSPDRWPHSTYAGYARKGSRVDWIDYEQLLHAWTGEYVGYRSGAAGREMAAYLCRQWTGVSLAKLSAALGLEHPDSSSNLVRRAEESLEYQKTITSLENKLGLKTENQV